MNLSVTSGASLRFHEGAPAAANGIPADGPTPAIESWLPAHPSGLFESCFERKSFGFDHGLSDHPLFGLPAFIALAQRRPDNLHFAYWSNGSVVPHDRWEQGMDRGPSLVDTIANIETNHSLFMLRHLEGDPEYAEVIGALFARIVELCGARMRKDVVLGRASVIVASPNRITPYHIDSDSNFLLQIAGTKRLNIHDHTDRSVTGDRELEEFFAGDFNGAVYRPEHQFKATAYRLGPGDGVHIPITAPHWGTNNGQVSIALSLAYDLRSGYRLSKLHQMNRRLRSFDLEPSSPGTSRWGDNLKLAAKNVWSAARFLGGKRADPSTRWGWRP